MDTQITPLPTDRDVTLRVTTQPNDANPKGDIFGGWLMSKIDIAGGITAKQVTEGEISTVAVSQLQFINPLYVHNLVSFYTQVKKIGHTSITIEIDVYAQRNYAKPEQAIKIATAEFVYVAVSAPGEKRVIKQK
ncbi:MAG: acyl-CoA thioesterase [Gammaproteobacteria bacterium]